MSETDLTGDLYSLVLNEGHHGIVGFGMYDSEVILSRIGFGESQSIRPILTVPEEMHVYLLQSRPLEAETEN